MKTLKILFFLLIFTAFSMFESCGPVIVSSRPGVPPPDWFYPDRVVNLRYVYFPDYYIYYDLTLRKYIYLDNGVWITVDVLPPRFNVIDFRHARRVRVTNYFGDNIRHYHSNIRTPIRGRRDAIQPRNSRTNKSSTRTSRRRGDTRGS